MSDVDQLYFGIVIWFSGTYGFIEWEIDGVKQKDIFCYYLDINTENKKVFKSLHKGQKASFNIGTNNRGEPKAINISVLNN